MPTELTKDILREKFVEMCREEMLSDTSQEVIGQGIQSYAKLTEMAQETDNPARAALFYAMSNYLDDVIRLHTRHGLGQIMKQKSKDGDALYEKLKNDGLVAQDETAEERAATFDKVYKTCKFNDFPEVTEFREESEALNDKIRDLTNCNSTILAEQSVGAFLEASDAKKLQVINGLVGKLSGVKEFDKTTFTKAERAFITIAAETAHSGFNRAMSTKESEYFSEAQSDQLRLRMNMLDGKKNDYSIPRKISENSQTASSALYSMGTDSVALIPRSEEYDDPDYDIDDDQIREEHEVKTPADLLLDNQLICLNKMMKSDSLEAGKFAVFSLSNSSELPRMTAAEFIESAKEDDLSIGQSMWAEDMANAFLDKLNKNGANYTADDLMVDGEFIKGKTDLDKKEKFVAAALSGKKLDVAVMEKDNNGNITSSKTMPIQLNDCMEKSWSFIEWLKSLFGLDRESKVKAANESVRDESKRANNNERIKMSFDELLGDSNGGRKTVKIRSAEKERSLDKKPPEKSGL